MGNQKTKSPKPIRRQTTALRRYRIFVNVVSVAAMVWVFAAAALTSAQAQSSSLLPRFSNALSVPPATDSPSVNMKLAEHARRANLGVQAEIPRDSAQGLERSSRNQLLPVRYRRRHRRQDGDVFGEDQAGGGEDPFGEPTVQSPIQESPFKQIPPTQPTPTPRPRDTQITNPFGEPALDLPTIDPSPRTPPMDTTPVAPRLPRGSEFTPDPMNIPELPKPDGGTRETEKARTQRSTPDPDDINLEDFRDRSLEEEDPQARRPTPARRGDRDADYDDPRRPFRSNVYRPAPEPSYYSNPVANPYANPNASATNPYANAYANPYANPNPNPYANPYALNPYLMNPYANSSMPNPYMVNPYMANPYAGYVCPPACQSCAACPPNNGDTCCPSCSSLSPVNRYAVNRYAGCPTPTPAGCDDGVYEDVIDDGSTLGISGRSLSNPLMPSGVPLYYVSLFGGWSDLSDLEIVSDAGSINLNGQNGLGLGAAFGQIQGKNLRSELEFSYRNHDVENLFLSDLGSGRETINGVGDIESYAGMLNLYWEFVDLCGGSLSPYIGAGVGAVNVSADMRLSGGQDALSDGEDSSFAYQYIVGVNYKVRPYSDLFVEYRHFAADSLRLDTNLPAGSLLDGDGELNYQTNNIFFGMRLKF